MSALFNLENFTVKQLTALMEWANEAKRVVEEAEVEQRWQEEEAEQKQQEEEAERKCQEEEAAEAA